MLVLKLIFFYVKQRKSIIKSLKSFIAKIACEEYGHLMLLAIFDQVDDTKIVSKIILDELFHSIKDIIENEYGRKVVKYLVAPRDTKFFIKDYIKRLEAGDGNENSKKPQAVRSSELLEHSLSYLNEYLSKNLTNVLLNNPAIGVIMPLVISKLNNPSDVLNKLSQLLLAEPYEEKPSGGGGGDEDAQHLVENQKSHLILKHIFQNEKFVEEKKLKSKTSFVFIC